MNLRGKLLKRNQREKELLIYQSPQLPNSKQADIKNITSKKPFSSPLIKNPDYTQRIGAKEARKEERKILGFLSTTRLPTHLLTSLFHDC